MRSPTDLPPRRPRVAGGVPNRGRIILLAVVVVLVVLLLSARGVASFATDYLWFRQLRASEVFTSVLWSKILLVLVFGAFAAAVLVLNLRWADAIGNVLVPRSVSRLPRDSVVNMSQLFTVDREALTSLVAALPPEIRSRIDEGLRLILAL